MVDEKIDDRKNYANAKEKKTGTKTGRSLW
jgi:hypothetical protein